MRRRPTTRRFALAAPLASVCLHGCLWASSMGEVDAQDAGSGVSRERFEEFAAQLVGTFTGTASGESVTLTQTFNADGTFIGACDTGGSVLLAGLCQGIEGEGTYVLTRFDASGDAAGVLTDSSGRTSQLEGMRLSIEGKELQLTYLLIGSFEPAVADRLRDAGLSIATDTWRSYVVLRRPL